MNNGILFALLANVLLSAADLCKKRLVASCDPLVVLFIHLPVGVLVGLLYLHLSGNVAPIPASAWWPAFIVGTVLVCAEVMFLKAIELSELSLVVPLSATLPVFGMILGMMFLGEDPNMLAMAGVALTVIGSYLLFRGEGANGIFGPLLAIFANIGARYMVLGKFIAALVMVMFKLMDPTSSPVIFFCLVLFFEWLFVCSILIARAFLGHQFLSIGKIADNFWLLIGSGVLWGAGLAAIFVADSLTLVVYVTAIIQLQMLIVVPLAAIIFKERALRQRLSACLVMIAGVLVIVFFGQA